jgi:hypothetical protein
MILVEPPSSPTVRAVLPVPIAVVWALETLVECGENSNGPLRDDSLIQTEHFGGLNPDQLRLADLGKLYSPIPAHPHQS